MCSNLTDQLCDLGQVSKPLCASFSTFPHFIHPSFHLTTPSPVHPPAHLTICSFTHPPVTTHLMCLSACQFTCSPCLSVHLLTHLSTHLFTYILIHQSTHPLICLSTYQVYPNSRLSISASICPPKCPSFIICQRILFT